VLDELGSRWAAVAASVQGLTSAFCARNSGRLGSRRSLPDSLSRRSIPPWTTRERSAFGRKIIDHQGLVLLLADMAAAVDIARATYLEPLAAETPGAPTAGRPALPHWFRPMRRGR
jgi:hypothetical protein